MYISVSVEDEFLIFYSFLSLLFDFIRGLTWLILRWSSVLRLDTLVAQTVKASAYNAETWVWSLGWEDPLEKGNGNPLQYSCLEIPWWMRVVGYSPRDSKESDMTEWLHFTSLLCSNYHISGSEGPGLFKNIIFKRIHVFLKKCTQRITIWPNNSSSYLYA